MYPPPSFFVVNALIVMPRLMSARLWLYEQAEPAKRESEYSKGRVLITSLSWMFDMSRLTGTVPSNGVPFVPSK